MTGGHTESPLTVSPPVGFAPSKIRFSMKTKHGWSIYATAFRSSVRADLTISTQPSFSWPRNRAATSQGRRCWSTVESQRAQLARCRSLDDLRFLIYWWILAAQPPPLVSGSFSFVALFTGVVIFL